MKEIYLRLIFWVLIIIPNVSFSQVNFAHSINVSGNDISNPNGSVSYTVGQVFFTSIESPTHYLNEGIQQVYKEETNNDSNGNDDNIGNDNNTENDHNTENDDSTDDSNTTSNDNSTGNDENIDDGNSPGNATSDGNNEDIDIADDIDIPEINLLIYPNPTPNTINLMIQGLQFHNKAHSYQLYNIQGKLLANTILSQQETQIDLTQLSTSIYILQVFVEEKLWDTFKIFKK
ncbi:hypothetical protein MHTCC0001_26420 [Flavobacteriaceae bacterium MHTCC 0001]